MERLQRAFQQHDPSGAGVCKTAALVRTLQIVLTSQSASQLASHSWVRGVRHVCQQLEARVAAAQQAERSVNDLLVNHTVAWEEVLEIAKGLGMYSCALRCDGNWRAASAAQFAVHRLPDIRNVVEKLNGISYR